MKMITACILLATMLCACASRSEKLAREYDLISRKLEGVQEERKALVKLEVAIQNCIKAEKEYRQSKREFHQVREKNDDEGLPVSPKSLEDIDDYQKQLDLIKGNYDTLSENIEELEQERNRIVEQQVEQ